MPHMGRLLFTVEERFVIKGRGLVPLPGMVPEGREIFRLGDPILVPGSIVVLPYLR